MKNNTDTPLTIAAAQASVGEWMRATFPDRVVEDSRERGFRLCEEALELAQAVGVTRTQAAELVRYVFGRDSGTPEREAGDVLITLAALCGSLDLNLEKAFLEGIARNWEAAERIRAKHEAKTTRGPLPGEAG